MSKAKNLHSPYRAARNHHHCLCGAAILTALALGASACSDASADQQTELLVSDSQVGSKLPGLIVEAQWLAEHQEDEGILVIDSRSKEAYDQGHIPGAISLPVNDTFDSDPTNKKNLASTERIQEVFRASGVTVDQALVIYAEGDNYRTEARCLWVFEVHGHLNAAVLNGGMQLWKQEGLPVVTTNSSAEPSDYLVQVNPTRLASKLSVIRAIDDPDTILLDVRNEAEFSGEQSKARRSGHIPTAINIPVQRAFDEGDETCVILRPEELRDLYANLDRSKKIIIYCNGGKRATASYLTLRSLEFDVSVYDGSWLEWGNDESLPIEGPSAEVEGNGDER